MDYLAAYPDLTQDRTHYVFFTSICHEVGLRGNFGTHSLDLGLPCSNARCKPSLCTSPITPVLPTKQYLGITNEELEDVVKRVNL